MELQCPKCGKPARGLCGDCYIRDHPLQIKIDSFRQCECFKFFYKGAWHTDKLDMLKILAEKSIIPPAGVKIYVQGVEYTEGKGKLHLVAKVKGFYEKVSFEKTLEWDIIPERVKCEDCRKLNTGYYEAVLQVRDLDTPLDLDKKQIAGVDKVRGGINILIISNDYARSKASELIDKGYLIVRSSTLYSKKDGKDLYRNYYSIKAPSFSVGDFLIYEDKLMRILELRKVAKLLDVESSKARSVNMGRIKESKIVAKSSDVRSAIVTEIRPDGIQILDQSDYKTHELRSKKELKAGQEIEYILYAGKIHLL